MTAPSEAEEILAQARTVLVVDWPAPEVPASLARAGLRVFVHGGPRPDEYTEHEVVGSQIVVRHIGRAPDQADLVYSYRPLAELPEIVALARSVGARAIWAHPPAQLSGEEDERARRVVEAAGLRYVCASDIVEQVRGVRGPEEEVHEPGTPS